MMEKFSSFAVIGLGTFGTTVASELTRLGNHVLGIDSDEASVSRLADTLAEAIIADGRDEDALREAGVGNYEVVVVAIGEDLEANVLCTMNVKLLGVKTVWVKALSRTHHRILTKLGADRVIHPEEEIGQHVAQMLHNPLVHDYLHIGDGYHVVNVRVPEQLGGTAVASLELMEHFQLRCLGLMRANDYVVCGPDTTLQKDDKLLLLGRDQSLRKFGETLL